MHVRKFQQESGIAKLTIGDWILKHIHLRIISLTCRTEENIYDVAKNEKKNTLKTRENKKLMNKVERSSIFVIVILE